MSLRLLLIEDSPDDEALLLHMLKGAGFELDPLRVETAEAMTNALQRGSWDIIVSDFNLPTFDGLEAIDVLKAAAVDVPLIIVSGTVGEEIAVEAMRRGAQDYVMKSNLRRLPEVIRRELREAAARRERRSLEEQLRHVQKMEALGQLASSVAHDFNNLLTVMISFSQFVHDDLPPGHDGRKDLSEVVECGNRAALLTRQLLAFSRKSVADPRVIDLNDALAAAEKMLKRLVGSSIDYATVPSPQPAHVFADHSLIEQVLVNLVVNARDAMTEGGKMTVGVALHDAAPGSAGKQAELFVRDTGCGIDDETLRHIFEPFFTTKGPGRGTGLGLSTVDGIVKQSGGRILVDSVIGKGTTFRVMLPRVTLDELPAREATAKVSGGHETVLVVEDQEPVRAAVHRALASRGYHVLETARPTEALDLMAKRGERVHLVLTDLAMPEMTGKSLADRVRQSHPDVAVVYMSGFAAGAMTPQGLIEPGATFIQKPFTPERLLVKVRAALDAKTA